MNEDERHEPEIERWRRKDVFYFRNDGSVRYVTSTYIYTLYVSYAKKKAFFGENDEISIEANK